MVRAKFNTKNFIQHDFNSSMNLPWQMIFLQYKITGTAGHGYTPLSHTPLRLSRMCMTRGTDRAHVTAIFK